MLFGPGNTLTFDGVDDFVSLPSGIARYDSITIEDWVYWEGPSDSDWRRVFDFGNSSTTGYMFLTPRNAYTEVPRFGITTGDLWHEQVIDSSIVLTTDQWHHFAVTIDDTTDTGIMYIDGREVGRNDSLTIKPSDLGDTPNNYLGDSQFVADTCFYGKMDEVRIWSTVRSRDEIRDNINKNLWGTQTGLEAYYRFDEDSGTLLPDLSGNGRNGTLNNMTDNDWVKSYAVIGNETAQGQDRVRGYWNGATDSSWNNSSGLWMNGATFSNESDFTVFGHNSFAGTTDADLPAGVKRRLSRIWYLDENGSVVPDVNFNLEWAAGTGLEQIAPSSYVLLNRAAASGDFSEDASASTRSGWEVAVVGVTLLDTYYYTLGTYPTPTPTPSVTPTSTPTPSITPTPSMTPTPSVTPTPSPSVTPTSTPSVTPTPTPSVTPTPSTTPTPTPFPTPVYLVLAAGDYTGDGTSDIAVFRQDNGLWSVRGLGATYFGRLLDIPSAGDYDGDGITDVAIFRPSSGLWAIKTLTRFYFGGSDDLAVPGDYDGDGTCDSAVFRGDDGRWSVRGITLRYFGNAGDLPVPGDYDDDGTAEIAVFRDATGLWAVLGQTRCYYGRAGDRPVPGIYKWTGSFPWLPAIFRPANGLWAIRTTTRFYYGRQGDTPLVGDFTGDALDNNGVFRGDVGLWAIRGLTRVYFGRDGDSPVSR